MHRKPQQCQYYSLLVRNLLLLVCICLLVAISIHSAIWVCSYLEQEQHTFFSAHSLEVDFTGTEHHMQIDLTSIEALELIRPATLQNATKHGGSLFRSVPAVKLPLLSPMPRKIILHAAHTFPK